MHPSKILLGGAMLLAAISSAQAAVTFDQNLTSPGAWFDGSGNPNGGFTLSSNNGITIGLRAKLRQDPNVIHSPDGIYNVPAGPQISSPSHAAWNWEFSIACDGGVAASCPGAGSPGIGAVLTNSFLTVSDLTSGHSNTVSMVTWLDDATWGTSGKSNLADGTSFIAQNSENPIFGDFPLAAFYDENAADAYNFTLNVYSNPDKLGLLASDSINVLVGGATLPSKVPEPITLSLFGAGLGGLVFTRRKRKKS